MNPTHSYGASVPLDSWELPHVDYHQTDLQQRITRLFPDAHSFYWKLTQWPDTDGRQLHVSWLSYEVPWSHRCRFQCPLDRRDLL